MIKIFNFKKFDYILFLLIILICFLGIIIMYSASSDYAVRNFNNDRYFFNKQLVFLLVGLLIMIIVSNINYKLFTSVSYIFFIISLVLVIMTILLGAIRRGSIRWIEINGITFQSSELVKFSMILFLSNFITKNYYSLTNKNNKYKLMMIIFVPSFIVSLNNLSTGIILLMIGLSMYFIISKQYVQFILIVFLAILFYIFADDIARLLASLKILREYQLERIYAWKNPIEYQDSNYQIVQGLYAIASGNIFGRGFGQSIQKSLIPEPQNDMIFSILCEEIGLVGAYIIILIYVLIVFRILCISFKQKDLEAMLICFGVAIHISIQAILNISVNLNLIPNTGVTLPFVSYGGSSLIVLFCEMALVMNISKNIYNN